MDEGTDQTSANSKKLKLQYRSIFDEITVFYERINSEDLDTFLDASDLTEINIKKSIKVIEEYWDIQPEFTMSDYLEELSRLGKTQTSLPDIPTYQFRFALEEGSWIVLLRDYFPKLVNPSFNRLITLEDMIWTSGKAQIDDYAYYLLEIEQVSMNWILPMVNYWIEEHDYGSIKDLAPRIISAAFQKDLNRGKDIFDGTIRLLRAKLQDLSKIKTLEIESVWAKNSIEMYSRLVSEADSGEFTDDTYSFLITLGILQFNVNKSRQQSVGEKSSAKKRSSIIDKINWNDLNLEDQEELEDFLDDVLLLLFDQPESSSMDAGIQLLEDLFEEIRVSKLLRKKTLDEFHDIIDVETSDLIDSIERERKTVEILERIIPQIFLELKQLGDEIYENEQSIAMYMSVDPIWDNFEAQLLRMKRVSDQQLARSIADKLVKSFYELMITRKMTPLDSTMALVAKFHDTFTSLTVSPALRSETIAELIKNETPTDGSLKKLDGIIIDYLAKNFTLNLYR